MKKRLKKMSIALGLLIVTLVVVVIVVTSQPRFGQTPQGERLAHLKASPNYKDEVFVNAIPTETVLKEYGIVSTLWRNLWNPAERQRPSDPLPVVKTDLKALDREKDALIWLGHSSFLIQLAGLRILVDPVLSDYAAPFSFLNKSFAGTNLYAAEELPEIDLLLISHDHWDHLDYQTSVALRDKIKLTITPLGVGEHFERWGYPKEKLLEGDWRDDFWLENGLRVVVLPARHFSGRLFVRNKTLWAGFVLQTPKRRIFLSGDSGYGPHFAELGQSFQGFDLVAMDGGQYDSRWPYIHMTPEEAVQAAKDVGAARLLPGHVGRFDIANHPWDEPFERFAQAAQDQGLRLVTPRIGEQIFLDDETPSYAKWWKTVN